MQAHQSGAYMKLDLIDLQVLEAILVRRVNSMNLHFLSLPDGSIARADAGILLGVVIDALEAVHVAVDACERVNIVQEVSCNG
jgi:hypothetical protein